MSIHCVFNSTDPDNYSKLSITIPPLNTKYTAVSCTAFCANCNIRVLNSNDYMTVFINHVNYTLHFEDYTNLNVESFASLLISSFDTNNIPINVSVDNCNRYVFQSDHPFSIKSLSYNVKLLTGLYYLKDDEIQRNGIDSEYISDTVYRLQIKAVGFFLSTPVLNLISNIGDSALRNDVNDTVNIQSCQSVLRINNSYSPNLPIVASGDGSTSIVPSNYVSGSYFVLVDSNYHQIDLLSPMYISLTLEPLQSKYDNYE